MINTKILLGRKYFGIGDWLMMFTCIQAIKKAHPQLQIDLDISNLPPFFLKLIELFELDISCVKNPSKENYAFCIEHFVYPSTQIKDLLGQSLHLIEGMLISFYLHTGIKVKWDKTLVNPKPLVSSIHIDDTYVILPSCGKNQNPDKEWSLQNFELLAKKLKKHFKVVQIGAKGDPKLDNADLHFIDIPPNDLAFLIKNAAFCVSLENMLYHLCAIYQTKACVLFLDQYGARGENSRYLNQIPLVKQTLTADEVYEACQKLVSDLFEMV
jgi:hypothetical protein